MRDILNMLAPHKPSREITLAEPLAGSSKALERDLELAEPSVQSRSDYAHRGEGAVHCGDGVPTDEEGENRDVGFWG